MRKITAVEMARDAGIDPKAFRRALRQAGLRWHTHNHRWVVALGESEHDDMKRVLKALLSR